MSNSPSSPVSSTVISSKRNASSVPRPLQLQGVSRESPMSSPLGTPTYESGDVRSKRTSRYIASSPMRTTSGGESSPVEPPSTTRSRPPPSRRQSSIAYFSATQDIPRSPVGTLPPPSRSGDTRPRSLNVRAIDVNTKALRRSSLGPSPAHSDGSPSTASLPSFQDHVTAPLTLVEKHTDLLAFIAQKEAKCMELRAQLATHEEELSLLKYKWERIIGRKLTHASGLGLAGPLPTDSNSSGAMFDGLKEGVQGAARLLVAGLADLSAVSPITIAPPSPSDPSGSSLLSKAKSTSSHRATSSTSSISTAPSPLFSRTPTPSGDASWVMEKEEDYVATSPASSGDREDVVESSARRKLHCPGMRQRRSADESKLASTSQSISSVPSTICLVTPQPTSIPKLFDGIADPTLPPPITDWVKRRWAAADGSNQMRDANRRASLLIADVGQRGQSWLASFSSATTSPTSQLQPPLSTRSGQPSPVGSLLDDDGDDPWAAAEAGNILIPDTPTVTSARDTASAVADVEQPRSRTSHDDFGAWSTSDGTKTASGQNDDDDWNW